MRAYIQSIQSYLHLFLRVKHIQFIHSFLFLFSSSSWLTSLIRVTLRACCAFHLFSHSFTLHILRTKHILGVRGGYVAQFGVDDDRANPFHVEDVHGLIFSGLRRILPNLGNPRTQSLSQQKDQRTKTRLPRRRLSPAWQMNDLSGENEQPFLGKWTTCLVDVYWWAE